MPEFSKLLVDSPAPRVLRLLINRPEKRNAIDFEVREQLIEALSRLPAKSDCRAIVLGGAGGNLSAGGDLPSMVGLDEAHARKRMQHIAQLCRLVYTSGLPVVTVMQGISAGACVGLALLGDRIVVGESTRILFPFMKLGLVPDWGLLHTLPRRVGLGATRRLLVSGDPLSGVQAHALGLADELAPDAETMSTAVRCAVDLAALPCDAFARMKRRLSHPSASLHEELEREEDDQTNLLLSADFQEGYAAFLDKRPPNFTGE
jgi:2-(1,2-epoxy-1,2-dihydrophenyl)acetyl-CoA isomerase